MKTRDKRAKERKKQIGKKHFAMRLVESPNHLCVCVCVFVASTLRICERILCCLWYMDNKIGVYLPVYSLMQTSRYVKLCCACDVMKRARQLNAFQPVAVAFFLCLSLSHFAIIPSD